MYTPPSYTYRQHISLCIYYYPKNSIDSVSERRTVIRDQDMNRLFTKRKNEFTYTFLSKSA